MTPPLTAEKQRLLDDKQGATRWKLWGPYLSERQWGTVREDYSADGDAWNYLPHDHARSRAYRWGEDGIAGFSDDHQRLCFALALWNGRDPILKERLFGLTNGEGNHGEDVKELYYYLDATPTHSYLKMLYKYPQAAFPYADLIERNRKRGKLETEYELLDTGVFDQDRYFDVFVEYAKAAEDDTFIRITVHNRGPEPADIHLLPQLWFRNTWAWENTEAKPSLQALGKNEILVTHEKLDPYHFYVEGTPDLLFCENDTNTQRLFGNPGPSYPKDSFHAHVINQDKTATNPQRTGTKTAAHYFMAIPAGGSMEVRLRLSRNPVPEAFAHCAETFVQRAQDADAFYAQLQHNIADDDQKQIQRQALAGMIWCKQSYHYNVREWLRGDPTQPPPPPVRRQGRNHDWENLNNADILSMPDKWEYPWFAAWDLAFHTIPLALIDPEFAKDQLKLITREWYMHPNGQLPAYEWAFGDVNPPVHAWAAWRVFQIDRVHTGGPGDLAFLESVFHKLMINFTWWVNRKDEEGRNIFQGGFLGLDNIGVFDRSAPLPTGGYINQADGTSWMAMYSLNLMRIALELARHNPVYQDIASKFFEHFLDITQAMNNIGDEGIGLWHEEDAFYYDVLNLPNGKKIPLKVRSIVGLIPLFAVETLEPDLLEKVPAFTARLEWVLQNRPDLAKLVSHWQEPGKGARRLLSLLRGHRMKQLLNRMLDESEFLSDHGIRALSRYHLEHPYRFDCGGQDLEVGYQPGESTSGLFGGNSNWRGPVWMPLNYLLIESLQKFYHYYGPDFKVECPTGSGKFLTILEVADELARRVIGIFTRDGDGRRPLFNHQAKMQVDPHFRDYLLFSEYFHGDDGHGLGSSHQTGWTGLVAKLLQPRHTGSD